MRITILGSGGVLPIPIPTCQCRVCVHARKHDGKDRRHGPAIFVNDANVLIDTPEDISDALNTAKIRHVEAIIYSHWHPDHTLGFRVVEALRENEFGRSTRSPIDVYIPSYDIENCKKMIPSLWHFESKGFVQVRTLTARGVTIGGIQFKAIRLDGTTFSAFEMRQENLRVIACPDHSKHFPRHVRWQGADLFIANLGYLETNLKYRVDLPPDHRIRSLTGFKDNLSLIRELRPRQSILTHIEDRWNRTHEELNFLARSTNLNVRIAFDGMKITIK